MAYNADKDSPTYKAGEVIALIVMAAFTVLFLAVMFRLAKWIIGG